jgi:hypothetical protein
MNEGTEQFPQRQPDCLAVLHDDGVNQPDVPVCIGGQAILGCIGADMCEALFHKRREDPTQTVEITRDESSGRVIKLETRGPEPGTYKRVQFSDPTI